MWCTCKYILFIGDHDILYIHNITYLLLQGCAIGASFCAASHLDLVVTKLEQVIKEEMVRKSKGFFGFSKVRIFTYMYVHVCKYCMYM